MDTGVSLMAGVPPGGSAFRRPQIPQTSEPSKAGSEAPPTGVDALTRSDQVVTAIGNTEKAGLTDPNPPPDKQRVAEAVKHMNDFLQTVKRTLQFTIDEQSGKLVVQIKDTETNQVIRQIPSEEALRIAEQIEKLKGMLIEDRA